MTVNRTAAEDLPAAAERAKEAASLAETRQAARETSEGVMTKVSIEEVRDSISGGGYGVTIVDSRSEDAWGASDIKAAGAIRIPPNEAEKHIADVSRDHNVYVYCT